MHIIRLKKQNNKMYLPNEGNQFWGIVKGKKKVIALIID